LDNPSSEILESGRTVWVGENEFRGLLIEKARPTPRGWLVFFEGVDGRDVAAALTNEIVYVRRSELPEPDDDEVYFADLVGLIARSSEGEELGTVVGFFDNGAHQVCVVERDGDEVLLPLPDDEFVEVDFEAGHLVIEVPEGIPGLDS
jgi:16S rRNA processing protein RimM